MPLYLASSVVKAAVERLGVSSTNASLGDYLIFKRALENRKSEAADPAPDGDGEALGIVTGTRSTYYVQAIREMALIGAVSGSTPPGPELADGTPPFFLPFGAKRETTRGYRSHKFPSNGSSDTISRWQARGTTPFQLIPDSKPKAYRFVARSAQQLELFFAVKKAQHNFSGKRPSILDTAVWWFRSTDLAERFPGQPSDEELVAAAVADLGLTPAELEGLFSGPGPEDLFDGEFT
ncbi:hypothetical protein [Streptomyces sp. NPDC020965]|uniref:hypothetical protein n=1 Tax=Streptomyces sp. NPDC020965 TaxID=3365105 RepID=UPI00378E1BD4